MPIPMLRRANFRRGFTLVEVAFSIAIIGVAVVTTMAMFGAGTKAMSMSRQRVVAAVTAANIIATYGAPLNDGTSITAASAPNGNLKTAAVAGISAISPSGPTLSLEEDAGTTLYAFPAAITAGDPRWNLVFQFSNPVSNGTQSFNILRVWSCSWRNAPTGVTVRGNLLGRFMYCDYQ